MREPSKSTPRKNAPKTRGKPFKQGNPGRPKGARHKTTLFAERLMQDDAADVVKKVIEVAKGGDMTAARIILDRICPPRKDSPIAFTLPKIKSAADAAKAMASILVAVAAGELTPGEAGDVSRLLEGFGKILEVSELEQRIAALEKERAQ